MAVKCVKLFFYFLFAHKINSNSNSHLSSTGNGNSISTNNNRTEPNSFAFAFYTPISFDFHALFVSFSIIPSVCIHAMRFQHIRSTCYLAVSKSFHVQVCKRIALLIYLSVNQNRFTLYFSNLMSDGNFVCTPMHTLLYNLFQ